MSRAGAIVEPSEANGLRNVSQVMVDKLISVKRALAVWVGLALRIAGDAADQRAARKRTAAPFPRPGPPPA
jgi:hypothetical protein